MSTRDQIARLVESTRLPRWLPLPGPLIVMLHGLGGADGVSPPLFEALLDALCARRRVVPLGDALRELGRPAAGELAAITFDDGYVDFAEHAAPVLARRGLHATLFVPAGHLGGSNVWDAGRRAARSILDSVSLRALAPTVVEIGAHGLTHRRLAGLDAPALHAETFEARRRLEDASGRRVRLFAYPYGQLCDFDSAAEAAVAAAGFEAACSTHFGRGSGVRERFRLRRVGIEPSDTLATFDRKLDGAYDWVRWKESAGARLRGLRPIAGDGVRRDGVRER